MVFGEPFYDEHLVRNPNDFHYNLGSNTILDNVKSELQKTVETGAQNIQTILDNIVQTVRDNYENYKQNQYNNQLVNPEPLFKFDLNPALTETNKIHEEFAEKEKRIRHLESIKVEHTNEISKLKAEKLEDKKKIEDLEKRLVKLENNPFMKWMPKAIEDSKKEKVL